MKNLLHRINLFSLGFAIVALVLHTICMATPYYLTIGFGMFMTCRDVKGTALEVAVCDEVFLKAVQVGAIGGVVLMTMGTLLLLLHVFKTSKGDRKRLLPPVIAILCVFGGSFILFADMLIYKEFTHPHVYGHPNEEALKELLETSKFSWGFYLDIVAVVFALSASLCQASAHRISRYEESGIYN